MKYKKLIYEGSTATVAGISTTPAVTSPSTTPANASNTNNSVGSALNKILPLVLGLGGASMLFGKGLFGIGGGQNGMLGGFWGKLIGGTALATVLPSLWSDKSIGDRLSSAFSKLTSGDLAGAFQAFAGLDSGADAAIKKTQNTVNQLALNKDTIESKAKQFTRYAVPFAKLFNWLQKTERALDTNTIIYLTPTVALTLCKTVTGTQQVTNNNKTEYIGVLFLNDEQQIQVQIAQAADLSKTINMEFGKKLLAAMTTNNLNSGINWLNSLTNPSIDLKTWFTNCNNLVKGLNTIATENKGNEIVLQLFNNGMTQLCESHSLKTLDLPSEIEESIEKTKKYLHIICEDAETSFHDLLDDPELAALKEDPTLNKFDEDITLLDEQINDQCIKLIQMLLLNQDENKQPIYKNPDACVIYGQLAQQHYFYCRDRHNAYLTNDVSKSVIFPVADIEKIANESPLEVSTGQHISLEEALPILLKEYNDGKNEELKTKFDAYKAEHTDITDINQLFKQFINQQGPDILPYKKEKRDIIGKTPKETLQNFLLAVKLPQVMKIKKPGIKVNVYETNLAFIEKLKTGLKEKFNVDIA